MSRRHGAAAFVAAASLTIGGVSAATAFATNGGQDEHKTSICHRTASDSNPYVFETVDDNSLPAHLNDLPGHPAKAWKTDGTFRGVAHVAGDLKRDYLATSALECQDTEDPTTEPTSPPTTEPTSPPTSEPTTAPTETPPTSEPTTETPAPSETPTPKPTPKPRPHTITHPDPAPPPPPVVIDAGL